MFRSTLELAGMVRAGELRATELVSECLGRIDELEPAINAFTHVAHDAALAEAASIDRGDQRPFAGVPIAIKDNRPVAGMPITMCSDLFGDVMAHHDAFLVRRLREAGFVIVGKTTLPEMGILPTTESRRFGPTRNPWALDRTPGGSSGGSAAAVAAGMVPIGHGNDGGGSIRIPASCCGLVGLKASRGRVSVGPDGGQSFLAIDGVMTRTSRTRRRYFDVISGYELGDANWAPASDQPFAQLAEREPGRLKVGLALNAPLEGAALDPECERAARATASLLESLGHGGRGDHAAVVESGAAFGLHARVRPDGVADDERSAASSPVTSPLRPTSSRSPGRCGSGPAPRARSASLPRKRGSSRSRARSSSRSPRTTWC